MLYYELAPKNLIKELLMDNHSTPIAVLIGGESERLIQKWAKAVASQAGIEIELHSSKKKTILRCIGDNAALDRARSTVFDLKRKFRGRVIVVR